jgi:hypothetical protein
VVQRTGPESVALKLGETSLRRLLELATKAREWAIAGELTAQLEAVEAARPGNVTHLDDRRKR